MRELRGLIYLAGLTFARQAWTKKTVIASVVILLACFSSLRWRMLRDPDSDRQQQRAARVLPIVRDAMPDRWILAGVFTLLRVDDPLGKVQREYKPNRTLRFAEENVMRLFVAFFLPVLALLYAAAALGDEYEERTLVYLLVRPLSLWRVYFAKAAGVVPLTVGSSVLAFTGMCLAAGTPGHESLGIFLPAVIAAACAYTAMFLLIGAVFPKPLVVGLAYAFFFEVLFGSLPGAMKRVSVAFYCRCMMFDAGSYLGFQPTSFRQFMPVSGETALSMLIGGTVVFLAVGAYLFHRREYRDLT